MPARTVEVRQDVLEGNDRLAAELRARFERAGTCAVNLVSSPGTGKTALLTCVLREMTQRGMRAAALVGDCATDNDARRLAGSGAPARQIVTEGLCHLEASMISDHLEGWDLDDLDFLFIENVGNLVCPASFDLGETVRVALVSVAEGEDKPRKYPQLFHSADLAVLTKYDLAAACEFDVAEMRSALDDVQPHLSVLHTSTKDRASVSALVDHLEAVAAGTTSTNS